MLKEVRPDMVLLDARLPDMDGIEVLEKIKESGISVKVIILSGLDNEELEERARPAGALEVLSKSMDLDKILDKISPHLT